MVQADDTLERLAGLVEELGLESLRPQITACCNLAAAGGAVDVAVLGRFKAGKSSFLNHLIGREVLPVGVVPLTAVITRLRYGPVERAEVRFLSGNTQAIPLENIGSYVAERENPDNRKQVAAVEVELPVLKDLAPMRFVDTPGLGSALAHNTEAAMKWLPNVGAALVAVSADAPLSERDMALLDELRQHTPRAVLLLTKADLLTDSQRAEVLAFVHQQLHPNWDGQLPVFFYSVRPGFERLGQELKDSILFPLVRKHCETGQEILRHKLRSTARQALSYLRVGLAAAAQAESARQGLAEQLAVERRDFGLFREELALLAQQWGATALEKSLETLKPVQEALEQRVIEELAEHRFAEWRMGVPGLLEAWREWLRQFLLCELSELSRQQKSVFCSPLHRAEQHLGRVLRAFQDRLRGHVKQALGVELGAHDILFELQEPTAPPVDVSYAVDVAVSTAGYLMPRALFGRPIQRLLIRKACWEVEKNISRLAAAWRDRVTVGIGDLVQQAERMATEELSTLEQMVARAQSAQPRLAGAVKELEVLTGCKDSTEE